MILCSESSRHCLSQRSEIAEELKLLQNVYPPPSGTCHVSRVRCQVSHFFSHYYFFFDKVVVLVGGGSVINGAYPSSIALYGRFSPASVSRYQCKNLYFVSIYEHNYSCLKAVQNLATLSTRD